MRLESFACLGSVEIANLARSFAYANNVGGVAGFMPSSACPCGAYDEGDYTTPDDTANNPAPWYDATRPDSEEFYGVLASNFRLSESPLSREVSPKASVGSKVGPMRYSHRLLTLEGHVLASSPRGMAYGERWLTEALRGNPCADGSCAADDLLIVPACPSDPADYTGSFRTLVNVGLVDGPLFSPEVSNEAVLQRVDFSLVAGLPWLYHPAQVLLNNVETNYGSTLNALLTTSEWMGDGTFYIKIANNGLNDATDIVITGQISIDGDCPVTGDATSVPPSFTYEIPSLLSGDSITIDGMRRRVTYYDASCKQASSGLPYIDFTGPWRWPDVGPCTSMCLSFDNADGDLTVYVEGRLREM